MNIQNFNAMIQLIYSHKSFDAVEDIRSSLRTMLVDDGVLDDGGSTALPDRGSAINRMASWLDIDRIESEKLFDIGVYVDAMLARGVCGIDLAVSIVGILEAFRDTGKLSWGDGANEKMRA